MIVNIRNLSYRKLHVYFKDYTLFVIKPRESCMFLVYDNFDDIVFLPVHNDYKYIS